MVFGGILFYGKSLELTSADNQKFKINNMLEAFGFKILGIPHIGIRQRARIIFSMMKFNHNDTVLDAGCGIGLYAFEIYWKVAKIIGIDLNKEKIKQAKELAKRSGRKIEFIKGNLIKLKYNEKFDKIICSDVIEHIPEYKEAINSIANSLKKNGSIILTFPIYTEFNKKTYKKFGHVVPGYTEKEIEKLLKNNKLVIKRKKYYSGTFTKISFKIHNILLANKIIAALSFYPLYWISFLDIFSSKKGFDGIAILAQKQKN